MVLVGLSLTTLLISCGTKQSPPGKASESNFMAAFRQAHDHRDFEALSKLVCWDGVPPEMKKLSEDTFKGLMDIPIVSIKITTEHPKGRPATLTYVRNGITYKFNLPVIAELVVESSPLPNEEFSGDYYPLAVKDGRYCIAQMAPTAHSAMPQAIIAPSQVEPAAAQGALPPRLLIAIAENFPQYHVPAGSDLTGLWGKAVQEGSTPFLCHGDFDGNGLDDYAIVLIAQSNWRFVIFEQRPAGEFVPAYVARPRLPTELPKGRTENTDIEAPQELILEKLGKGQVWSPEAGDEPYEVKLQTDGIVLHNRKKLQYADLDETTLVSFVNGRFRQDNFAELLVPLEKPWSKP